MQTTAFIIWQKIFFMIMHKATLWLLLFMWITALASWYLAYILSKHDARMREARLARRTACLYAVLPFVLWLFTAMMD